MIPFGLKTLSGKPSLEKGIDETYIKPLFSLTLSTVVVVM